jgi:copper chaperone CopZ
LAVGAFVTWQGMARRPASEAVPPTDVITIAVEGMSCTGCAGVVTTTIEEIPGVAEVTVDFDSRLAHIRLADQGVDPATLVTAIESAGYRAHVAP